MKAIENRTDIELLVHRFYGKIRKDEVLGSIFNAQIPEKKWPEHLEKLTDFWESNLFRSTQFAGDPTAKHIQVDINQGHSIGQQHFERWLGFWFQTIEELYDGELAFKAKESARNMAMGQYLAILKNREN